MVTRRALQRVDRRRLGGWWLAAGGDAQLAAARPWTAGAGPACVPLAKRDGDSLRAERVTRGRRMVTRRAPQHEDRRRLGRWWRAARRSALAAGGW